MSESVNKPLWRRIGWLILAYVSCGIGIAAVFIPGVPTTEFILLSAYAASKGSPRLHRWLLANRIFGPVIRNWQASKSVARKTKISASVAMVSCALVMAVFVHQRWIVISVTAGMAVGAYYLWSRTEPSVPASGSTSVC